MHDFGFDCQCQKNLPTNQTNKSPQNSKPSGNQNWISMITAYLGQILKVLGNDVLSRLRSGFKPGVPAHSFNLSTGASDRWSLWSWPSLYDQHIEEATLSQNKAPWKLKYFTCYARGLKVELAADGIMYLYSEAG